MKADAGKADDAVNPFADWVMLADVAHITGLSKSRIQHMVRDGLLKTVKVGDLSPIHLVRRSDAVALKTNRRGRGRPRLNPDGE